MLCWLAGMYGQHLEQFFCWIFAGGGGRGGILNVSATAGPAQCFQFGPGIAGLYAQCPPNIRCIFIQTRL